MEGWYNTILGPGGDEKTLFFQRGFCWTKKKELISAERGTTTRSDIWWLKRNNYGGGQKN